MASYNKVILMGNLTRDPELRYTPNGQAVCNLGLAVNRAWKNAAGEKQEETLFTTVVVWGKDAENAASYLKKGKPILVDGRLQSRLWEKDGRKHTSLEVVSERLQYLSTGEGAKAPGAAAGGASNAPIDDSDIPF